LKGKPNDDFEDFFASTKMETSIQNHNEHVEHVELNKEAKNTKKSAQKSNRCFFYYYRSRYFGHLIPKICWYCAVSSASETE